MYLTLHRLNSIAGISRSATICAAYIMQKQRMSTEQAISLIRRSRVIVNPNDSFREQLDVFERDGFTVDEKKEGYRRWKLKKDVELATGMLK